MDRWGFILGFGMLLAITVALPTKHNKKYGNKRSDITKRTVLCDVAAYSLGGVIDKVVQIAIGQEYKESFQNVIIGATGLDVFNEEDRRTFFCRIEGLETLSELLSALESLNLDMKATEAIYYVFCLQLASRRSFLTFQLDQHYNADEQYNNADEQYNNNYYWAPSQETLDRWNRELNLLNSIESTGLIEQIPEGGWVQELSGYPMSDNYTPSPPSDQPLDAQCTIIANNVREIWNNYIDRYQVYDPNIANSTREVIRQWTGIEMSGHGHIRGLICELLVNMDLDGIDGMLSFIQNNDIFEHLLSMGYPMLIQLWRENEQELLDTLQPDYGYNYGPYSSSNYPLSDEVIQFLADVLYLLDILHQMGLDSLVDDFSFV